MASGEESMTSVHFNVAKTNDCDSCNLCCREYSGHRYVTEDDIPRIAARGATDFYEKKTEYGFNVLKDRQGYCMFYDTASKRCSIYSVRPADCRFFPYDVLLKEGKYSWIKWNIDEPGAKCLIYENLDDEKALRKLEDEVVPGFMKNIEEYALYTDRMIAKEKNDYKILREIRFRK